MLDKRSAALALVAVAAAAMPVAQALTYGELLERYGGTYGRYFPAYYGQYPTNTNITVPPTINNNITALQRALSGSTLGFGFAPVATALLVIVALAQLFV